MYRHNALSEGYGFIFLSNPFDLLPQCQAKMAVPAFWDSEGYLLEKIEMLFKRKPLVAFMLWEKRF